MAPSAFICCITCAKRPAAADRATSRRFHSRSSAYLKTRGVRNETRREMLQACGESEVADPSWCMESRYELKHEPQKPKKTSRSSSSYNTHENCKYHKNSSKKKVIVPSMDRIGPGSPSLGPDTLGHPRYPCQYRIICCECATPTRTCSSLYALVNGQTRVSYMHSTEYNCWTFILCH